MEFLSLLIVSILVWNSSGAELWSHLRNQKQAVRAKAADIKLYLYTNENTQGEEVLSIENLDDLINSNYYNHSLKNIFIMHGWIGTILNDVNIETKAAIFESGKPANIFVVDWSIPAGQFYPFAVWSIPSVGQIIANYIDKMINHFGIDGSDFILVGHSIGAHLAGVVGSNLNGTIGQIVGLDPVWILFSIMDDIVIMVIRPN
ncbi:lipase [Holotrichia oblita]|uniref:Lipase n=1 Tax=Holotrichia oblita TaxID=644536 RepID=A0ACB9T6N5_HOLOL|nr:lipase [Holotrichia oblita]